MKKILLTKSELAARAERDRRARERRAHARLVLGHGVRNDRRRQAERRDRSG